jgi:putative phosphoribosyl transferase
MMYFESRVQAGKLLADQLVEKYRYENCAIVALSDGGVVIGEEIAAALHCILTMLVTENVDVPGESATFGAVAQTGEFTYNSNLSSGEMEEYTNEFHGYLEDQKRVAFEKLNRLIGDGGTIDYDLLRDHTIILVSDGLGDGATLDVAFNFLKPIRIERLIIAAPVASVGVVDKVHITADELHILDVKQNFLDTNHYYEKNDLPSHEDTIKKINQTILNWH